MAEAKEVVDPKDALDHGYWGYSLQESDDRVAHTMAGQTGAGDPPKEAEKPAVKPRAQKETAK